MKKLEDSFKTTSRILLGGEIGELGDLKGYLLEMVEKPLIVKSSFSGKEIYLSRGYYNKNARFIELENIGERAPELDIDEIKDLDSLLSSTKENLYYCGNHIIGNSLQVEKSDSCADGIYVLNSHQIMGGKNIAYSHGIRKGENVYGSVWSGEVGFLIKCQGLFYSKSCFDSYLAIKSRNLYCSFNCRSCSETMFSFNQVSKQFLIGNLQLPKDKYYSLKEKLLGEIRAEFERKKYFPSIFDLVEKGGF